MLFTLFACFTSYTFLMEGVRGGVHACWTLSLQLPSVCVCGWGGGGGGGGLGLT